MHEIPSDEWKEISDIGVFMHLRKFKEVFDTVEFFDYRPLIPLAKHITVEGALVKTGNPLVADKLRKMPFLKLQSKLPRKNISIFRITNYDNRDFKVFDDVSRTVEVFIFRSMGGLGDVIMTTPVVEEVKRRNPKSHITYACPKEFLPIMEGNPYIDVLEPFKAKVTQQEFDIVIDISKDCIKYELAKGRAVDLNRPEIFLRSCGLTYDYTPSPKVFLKRDEVLWAKQTLPEHMGPVIGIVLTSHAPVRRWHKFEGLREELLARYPGALIVEISESTPKGWKPGAGVFPAFNMSLREISAIIGECDVVISPDTGPAHIASALRIPTVWLFTHINGDVRTRGYKDAVVVQGIDTSCPSSGVPCWYEIPCSKVDGVSIMELRDNPLCSQAIEISDVIREVVRILDRPQLTYVIVYHNQDDIVRECLRHVLEYRKYNTEVIVVDNASDNPPELIFGGLARVFKLMSNNENLGCAIARNQALRMARGRYVMFLDSDQYIGPESVQSLLVSEGDLVGTEAWSMDNAGFAFDIRDGKGRLAYVGAGGLIGRKEVFDSLDGFDEAYAPAWFEDPDLCFRAKCKGYTIGYHPNPGITHLQHRTVSNQKTFDSNTVWRRSHRIFMDRWKRYLAIRRIIMLVDVHGWAWDNKAQQVKKYLDKEHEICINYLSDPVGRSFGDELYFTFECNQHMFDMVPDQRPYISGVTAHTYINMRGYRAILGGAVATHANSMLLYEEIKQFNRNCHYLPNGVDEDLFRYRHRDIGEGFTVGYVGKTIPRKGFDEYIVPACRKAGVNLVTRACKYKDANKVDHRLMPKFYAGVDVVIIASDMDGTPNQLLEAASTGRTFIGNRIGNIPEFVEDGVNGFMVERDVDAYVEKLIWLRDNRESCRQMGVCARKTVEREWTWRTQAERYKEMIARCI